MIFYNDTFRKHRHGISFTEEDEILDHCANLHLLDRKLKVGDKVHFETHFQKIKLVNHVLHFEIIIILNH